MSVRELFNGNSGRIKETVKGCTCHREFIGPWDEVFLGAPKINSPHPLYPYMTVKEREFVPEGAPVLTGWGNQTELCRCILDYTFEYQRPKFGDPPRLSWKTESEALMTGQGRVWDDCGEVVEATEFSAATSFTMINFTADLAVVEFPISTILACINKVNDTSWQGCDAGTVLFKDFSEQAEWDPETQAWYYRAQYEFLWRSRPHNEVWRGPIPKRDSTGYILYYQNTDADGDNYTTDATKTGHPVPKGGVAGEWAWTSLTPAIYESADFSQLVTIV
ncbi:MAG: hypothetical protein ABFD54_05990 [Armatimonadota bacterium]|nr:hypothetical protein [bacterium]